MDRLDEEAREALQRVLGRRVVGVEHHFDDELEAVMLIFEGGDAVTFEVTTDSGDLDVTHLSPLARQVVQMQWANPAPADGSPLYTVERHGTTFAMTKEPVTGWRRVLWPVYRLLLAWNSRRGI